MPHSLSGERAYSVPAVASRRRTTRRRISGSCSAAPRLERIIPGRRSAEVARSFGGLTTAYYVALYRRGSARGQLGTLGGVSDSHATACRAPADLSTERQRAHVIASPNASPKVARSRGRADQVVDRHPDDLLGASRARPASRAAWPEKRRLISPSSPTARWTQLVAAIFAGCCPSNSSRAIQTRRSPR